MVIQTLFPEEREILREEELSAEKPLSKEIRKEILILNKLGLEDYEIRYLVSLKAKREASLKWNNNFDI